MPDEACRLARLEQKSDNLDDDIKRLTDKLDTIIESIDEMKIEQTRYKGFIGGVVFAVGALFSFLTWWVSR